jgi:serine/threonine-protein kinase
LPPQTIGRFRVIKTLGRGAMGVVYEAHDPVIDRKIAIKLVRTDLLAGEERTDYVERFKREAQAAGRCSHPCIVSIFDFALHEGNPFLAMEYVDGLGVDKVLVHGERFAPAAAVHVILQVLDALGSAHALGIVHRDIKPANILLTDGGRVKVTDFGIARLDSSDLTHVGMVIGTPSYMSPEQCRGGAVDLRSDLFSTAAVLQEMLIGERPFSGHSFTEVSYRLLNEPAAGGAELTAAAGTALKAVLDRGLAKRPEDRFGSAAIMAAALRQAVAETAHQEEPAAAVDKTVLAARTRGSSVPCAPTGVLFDPTVLSGIERRLARHLGPIARYLVQTSTRTATNLEDLCEALARRIDRPEARRQFLAEALEVANSGVTAGAALGSGPSQSPPSAPIAPDEIERAQRALAETLGPIARILVQRALKQVRTDEELWDLLAAQIGQSNARAEFLRRRVAG